MARLWNDCRSAFRSLRRGRAVTVFAALAFALGIGITTAVFTLFYSVLIKPLPYPDPDRLVRVYDVQPACAKCPASFEKYIDWMTRHSAFSVFGVSFTINTVLTGVGEAERIAAVHATHTLPEGFGVRPTMGRWFSDA